MVNRIYASALALTLVAGGAFAQSPLQARQVKQHMLAVPSHPTHPATSMGANRDVVWSDDFSNPSNWTFGNLDGTSGSWVIGTTPPSGSYAIPAIQSTTAANGFALYDSDLLNITNDNAWMATATSIDLSAYPGVVLEFQQFFRALNGDCYVETSTNGSNWTPILINADVAPNSATSNPNLRSINLSGQIGGSATAWIRFRYTSPTADYSWMIDDVSLVTLPDHEMIMDYGYTSAFGGGFEYGRVPASLMPSTMEVGASVINFGNATQNNVQVNVSVLDESDVEVATATTTIPSMISGDTIVTSEQIPVGTLPVGKYSVHFTMTSDDIGQDINPNNNSQVRYFAITQDLYSLDAIGVVPDSILSLTALGTASFGADQDVRLLNYYEVPVEETFSGVEIYLSTNNTDPGSYFTAAIYDTADVSASIMNAPLVESDIRVITPGDIATGVASVAFLDPITLSPNAYYVGVRMYREAGQDLYILDDVTVPQPWTATKLWFPAAPQVYSNGNAAAIRLSTNPSVGVQENPALQGVTMYPSPTSGPVEIRTKSNGLKTLDVYNALGKLVLHTSFSGMDTSIDLDGNAPGIYTVRVGSGALYNVQRIALK